MLVITEIAEAVEADRRSKHAISEFDITLAENEDSFISLFEKYVKDSFEDELADTYIRILDLSKHNNVVLLEHKYLWFLYKEDMDSSFIDKSFVEIAYAMTSIAASLKPLQLKVKYLISCLLWVCANNRIDLLYHVNLKMRYNNSREKMHGKKY